MEGGFKGKLKEPFGLNGSPNFEPHLAKRHQRAQEHQPRRGVEEGQRRPGGDEQFVEQRRHTWGAGPSFVQVDFPGAFWILVLLILVMPMVVGYL